MRKRILSLLLICFFLMEACYEPVEDCTDTFSNNYEVNTDEACEDCCTYPDLIFRFSHEYDGLAFFRDSAYLDDQGNIYRLKQFEFFVSNAAVYGTGNLRQGVKDSIDLVTNGIRNSIVDDITQVSTLTSSYNLGDVRIALTPTNVEFDLGIRYDLDGLNFDNLDSDNALKVFEDSLYLVDRFAFGEIELQRDTLLPEVTLILLDQINFMGPMTYSFLEEIDKGDDVIVNFKIDYKILMSGINVKMDNAADIKQRVVDNLPLAISVL